MRTPVFTGSCVAIATPFDANGTINYDAFGRLIEAQIAGRRRRYLCLRHHR